MSQETREPRAKETLTVTVRATPGSPEPIDPRSITLTDAVYQVVWQCDDLAPGATLLIHFREDPRGPFFLLEFAGNRVVGYGNRGSADTSERYSYVAQSQNGKVVAVLGEGIVLNEGVDLDPNPGPPRPDYSYLLTSQELPDPEKGEEEEPRNQGS